MWRAGVGVDTLRVNAREQSGQENGRAGLGGIVLF